MDIFPEKERLEFKKQLQLLPLDALKAMADQLADDQTNEDLDGTARARAVAKLRLVTNELEIRKLGGN